MRNLFLAAVSLILPFAGQAQSGIETPPFTVVLEQNGLQLREYTPMIMAEVTVEAGSVREASSRGFRPLAGYIFGGNQARDKIAMTAPVLAEKQSVKIDMTAPVLSETQTDGTYVVRFVMPSEWTMDTLPTPNNPNVKVVEQAPRTMVALRYVGADGPEIRAEAEAMLRDWLSEIDYRATAPAVWAGYDGPSVPRSRRRFEIMLPVEKAASSS